MKCSTVRNQFSRYLENDLDAATRQKIDQHLEDCAECEKELTIFINSMRILRAAVKVRPEK
ncbi:MAG: zf-HC2 domain-containing protein [Syntrophomonadaceae bacterium]|nr:zf-HC2 domain-containing protein [Syntrophomonadaceae bacterium]